jgi:membrane-bound lytic murein transglycosylase B
VDFDGDGQVDLAASSADAIGSVANFLASHGWEAGSPIACPANVAGEGIGVLIDAGILPRSRLPKWRPTASAPAVDAPQLPCALIDLVTPDEATEYWLGYRNFYVITRYNRSSFYAMAVYALSQELKAGKNSPPGGSER